MCAAKIAIVTRFMAASAPAHEFQCLAGSMPDTDISFVSCAAIADSMSRLQVNNSSRGQSRPQVEHSKGPQTSETDPFAPEPAACPAPPAAVARSAVRAALRCCGSGADTHLSSSKHSCHTAWLSADDEEVITVTVLQSFGLRHYENCTISWLRS